MQCFPLGFIYIQKMLDRHFLLHKISIVASDLQNGVYAFEK